MKNSFFKILLIGIFLSNFFGCSNVDESLERPPLFERLGYSKEQIQYWETDADAFFLEETEENALCYRNKEDSDIYVYYSFKNNILDKVIFGQIARSKEEAMSGTEQFFEILDDYEFTINLGERDSENKLGQLLANRYNTNLYCKVVSDFTDWKTKGIVINMMIFYKK